MNILDILRLMNFKKRKVTKKQLFTIWGEQINQEHILEEYPRPQLRRENYMILNGKWDYVITFDDKEPINYDGQILVPYSPESILSGVNRQLKPDGFLWYKREIKLEKIYKNKRFILHFGAVDQICKVWWNGKFIGEHKGGYLPFSFDVTDILRKNNILKLQVIDFSNTAYYSKGKQTLNPSGMFYTAQSGIWQTVWAEWVSENYIKSLKITPLYDENSVKLTINMNTKVKKIINIFFKGKLLKTVNTDKKTIKIYLGNNIYSWTPETPNLYDIEIIAGTDKVFSYFAMRKYSIGENEKGQKILMLNNKLYYQHGILDQGYWPDGLMTPPSDEAFIYDIKTMKQLGFNMIRKHIKIEPLRWYYHCDRLGMIVWQDMVNGGGTYNLFLLTYLPTLFPIMRNYMKDNLYFIFSRSNKDGRNEWLIECCETIKHLYNCPCISMWVPFNEGWGQFDAIKVTNMIKKLDSTRWIDHASGWIDQHYGDVKSYHNYFQKLDVKKDKYKRPIVYSEYGGFACYIKDHNYSNQVYEYRQYKDTKSLKIAYKRLQNKIEKLKQKGLCADVYTQLSDIEDEVNGILTYDRKVNKLI